MTAAAAAAAAAAATFIDDALPHGAPTRHSVYANRVNETKEAWEVKGERKGCSNNCPFSFMVGTFGLKNVLLCCMNYILETRSCHLTKRLAIGLKK